MIKKFFVVLMLSLFFAVPCHSAEIPMDAKLDYNQGIDFYKLGMYERAIESFRSAIRTYPDYTDAYYNLGLLYIDKLKYDLVRNNIINFEDIERAQEIANAQNTNLGQVLISSGLIKEHKT